MEVGCYMNEWFRVSCNRTGDGPKLFISSINLQLLDVSFSKGIVVVSNPITYSSCENNNNNNNNGVSVNLTSTPFFFSHIFNRFVSVGCGSFVTILPNSNGYPFGGCPQPDCKNVTKTSFVSCITKIPPGLGFFAVNMTESYPSKSSKTSSCGSAFLVDERFFPLGTRSPECNGMSSWTWTNILTIQQQWSTPKVGYVPTALQWGIPKSGQCELKGGSNTLCSSDGKYCWSNNSSTQLCVCSMDNVFTSGDDHSTDISFQGTYYSIFVSYIYWRMPLLEMSTRYSLVNGERIVLLFSSRGCVVLYILLIRGW